LSSLLNKAEEHFADQWEEDEEKLKQLKSFPHELELEIVRNLILSENKRVDGRKFDELRPLSMEVALLPRTHGSSLFTRGETQSLSVITLGTELDEQRFDDIEGEGTTRFMLHYNFPPFSVGEVGRFGPPGRREIGHGRLAERALIPVLPNKEEFPYAIRVVSEILESNGSSSMATVCAGCLALKDAGVPLKSTIAGIAMGLVKDNETGEYRILTDIQGAEDHLGDMDFKVAGSKNGITAFQLDLKIEGVSPEIMAEALQQAKKARIEIIEKMNACIDQPRDYLSEYAPRIITFSVHPEQIGEIIGPGGKIIKEIQARTQAKVEVKDDGTVTIYSKDENAAMDAYQFVQSIISEVEVGTIYLGVVKRINEMGAFIEILPGKEALCRVSQISTKYVHRIEDVVSVGDEIEVKVVEVDSMGRINVAHPEYEWRPNPRQSRGGGGGGRSHGGGGRSRGGYSGRGGYR
jgi:polyribonucleotide nucleotidyltransferase